MNAWQEWRELVVRDVRGDTTGVEEARLRQTGNLVMWLRALNYVKADVDCHIGDSRLRLQALAPAAGVQPSPEYIAAKRETDGRHAGRVKFKRAVEARLEECRFLLDLHAINPKATYGGLICNVARIADLLERDDLEAALRLARLTLDSVQPDPACG